MKTYDEALATVHFKVTDKAAAKAAIERVERSFDIGLEVIENDRTHALIRSMMIEHGLKLGCECETCQLVFCVAMSAYLNGIRVGMEMEKCELS